MANACYKRQTNMFYLCYIYIALQKCLLHIWWFLCLHCEQLTEMWQLEWKKGKWKYKIPLHTSLLTAWVYLFMPLQQYGTAIFYRPLKAFVDILHEKIDSILVERFNSRLNIAALKWCQHPQYHSLSSFLREWKTGKMEYLKQSCNLCSIYFILKRSFR